MNECSILVEMNEVKAATLSNSATIRSGAKSNQNVGL
jgi:hypothetical protein